MLLLCVFVPVFAHLTLVTFCFPQFVYVNQSFAPAPDQVVRNLYECFGSDGKLVLHYCRTQAWGWKRSTLWVKGRLCKIKDTSQSLAKTNTKNIFEAKIWNCLCFGGWSFIWWNENKLSVCSYEVETNEKSKWYWTKK